MLALSHPRVSLGIGIGQRLVNVESSGRFLNDLRLQSTSRHAENLVTREHVNRPWISIVQRKRNAEISAESARRLRRGIRISSGKNMINRCTPVEFLPLHNHGLNPAEIPLIYAGQPTTTRKSTRIRSTRRAS